MRRYPLGSPTTLGRRRLDAFHIICLVGRGGFGKVFLVRHKATGEVYAMKVMDKESLVSRSAVGDAHSERDILALLGQHEQEELPFIIRLHVAFQTSQRVYLVMDFASGGELMFHLRRETLLAEDDCKFYAAELLLALRALHDRHIIHRDIKPENVLLDAAGHLVLTDFGLAKQLSRDAASNEHNHSWCGSEDYMAPEIVANKKHSGVPADYWAFGVFIYDCLCGRPPFADHYGAAKRDKAKDKAKENGKEQVANTNKERRNRRALYNRILKQKLKLPQFLSAEAHNLLKQLLTRDPSKRLTDADEIMRHPWFAPIDWHKLRTKQLRPPFIPPASSPTACFSPSLTKAIYSAPHSPPDSATGRKSSASGRAAALVRAANNAAAASALAPNPNLHPNNPWQGFSFVAPAMEVHFALAPPAVEMAPAEDAEIGKFSHDRFSMEEPIQDEMDDDAGTDADDACTDEDEDGDDGVGALVGDGDEHEEGDAMVELQAEMAEFSQDAKEAVEIVEQ